MRKVAFDGTVLDAPDCGAHQHLGRSSGSRGKGPFPQVRKVSLVELGTHIEYNLDDPQRTGHDEVHRLMTNLFDAEEFPAMEMILEYHERWEIEMVLDEQKTPQDPCRAEKTTNLRSETSDGLKQEIYALSLGHFVTRVMMVEAAATSNLDVDRLSFKGCFQILKARLPECNASTETSFATGSKRYSGR